MFGDALFELFIFQFYFKRYCNRTDFSNFSQIKTKRQDLFLDLSTFIFFFHLYTAYGSNGCPKSKSLVIRGSSQIVTWETTWTDYQSKVCKWRLNFQTPEVVNFSLRLEKLAISSHDVFVYSGLGIVRKRFEDKVQVRVCGDGNQTELHMSAIGKELQFMGAALCFVIPHGDYNFGQDIFTTHFINMTISLRKQHYVG